MGFQAVPMQPQPWCPASPFGQAVQEEVIRMFQSSNSERMGLETRCKTRIINDTPALTPPEKPYNMSGWNIPQFLEVLKLVMFVIMRFQVCNTPKPNTQSKKTNIFMDR